MADDIKRSLSYLVDHLSNLESILIHLIENNVISQNESDEIILKGTPLKQNARLLQIIQKKDWNAVKELFLEILRKTNNGHCANTIEIIPNEPRQTKRTRLQCKLLKRTWWPDKKRLIKSLHERQFGDKLLIEELHYRLEKDENRMVVITESSAASKVTGMGGVGKTLTAIWYAHKYEQEYDHVLWIDSGEGSLLTSFKALARDLKIQDRNELVDVEEFSRKSYEELMHFKCLWIFDNAENYKGEGGMKKVLPKYHENFFCLTTSRSGEWGVKNIGYGKISDLQLDIFTEQESMDFFKHNFIQEINYTKFQLKELCRLLGNLPLAMQLAVAALNERKINFQNCIEKTSAEDVKNIVDVEFDDYEKTINASVKVTLDVLEKEKNGIVARDILTILGYIRPDDVILDFFAEVLMLSTEDVQEGIELLVKYSLISKELKTFDEETESYDSIIQLVQNMKMKTVSKEAKLHVGIHRLLQQVIRHNGREKEEEMLRKILGCKGFVDYKLIPFTKYADAELRKEFPKVKAELVDQEQLMRLVWEKRFDESVELAKFIDKELNANATKFNYSICLEKNGQLTDGIKLLEQLYQQEIKQEIDYFGSVELGLLKLEKQLSKELVGGHLLVSHWKLDNRQRLQKMLEERKSFKMIDSPNLLTTLLRILDSLNQSNYTLTRNGQSLLCQMALGGITKRIELRNLYLDDLSSYPLPSDLQELILSRMVLKAGKGMIDVSEWLPKKLNTLHISGYKRKSIILSLGSISSVENVTLIACSLSLDSVNRISPTKLKLEEISFIQNGQELGNANLNEFIDFHKTNRLQLSSNADKKNLSIDFSEECANIKYLHLYYVNVVTLKSANEKGGVKMEEGRKSSATEILERRGIPLPNLKCLTSDNFSHFSHFRSPKLTHMGLDRVNEVNVDLLPSTTKTIRIVGRTRITGGLINLDKLILGGFSLQEVEEMSSHFHFKQLVLLNSYNPVDLIPLMGKGILTKLRIAIGIVLCRNDDFQNFLLSKQVDTQSLCYLFHEGTGKAVEWKDFDELYQDIFEPYTTY